AAVATILTTLEKLEVDSSLLDTLHRRELIEKGLNLVDGPDCPLCDKTWDDVEQLRAHLAAKLAKSAEAARLQSALLSAGSDLARNVEHLVALLRQSRTIANREKDASAQSVIDGWGSDLAQLTSKLATFDGLLELKARLQK